MIIDWERDHNFVVNRYINEWKIQELMKSGGQERFWTWLKEELNHQFFMEVFPQILDDNWHCMKLYYVKRECYDLMEMGMTFGIAGKILTVREAPLKISSLPEPKVVIQDHVYMRCCSHCGCEWHPTPKGACSACGADARSALQLEVPHATR